MKISRIASAIFGLSVGSVFLWLAFRGVDVGNLLAITRRCSPLLLGMAVAVYWFSMMLRIVRWHLLLNQLAEVSRARVSEVLLVGYAANTVLPARLGEVVRAAYAGRRTNAPMTEVFGSIVIERALDLVALVICLSTGLGLYYHAGGDAMSDIGLIALNAGVMVLGAVGVIALVRAGIFEGLIPRWLMAPYGQLRRGLRSLNAASVLQALFYTTGIWSVEIAAAALVFKAFGVELSVAQALLMMGATALSTMIPTAPGYLGTYQYVLAHFMVVFGYDREVGLVAATAIQCCFLGTVSVAGGVLALFYSTQVASSSSPKPVDPA